MPSFLASITSSAGGALGSVTALYSLNLSEPPSFEPAGALIRTGRALELSTHRMPSPSSTPMHRTPSISLGPVFLSVGGTSWNNSPTKASLSGAP
jgi:hypothetical protein